jgi:hypothetical protein
MASRLGELTASDRSSRWSGDGYDRYRVNKADTYSQVWSKLQSLCLAQDRYINVPPLTDAALAYNPPVNGGNLCQCKVVAYALMVSHISPQRSPGS